MDLSAIPILQLLVELLYEGKSGLIPELERHEPLDVAEIHAELARRSGEEGADRTSRQWWDWYLAAGGLSEADRNTLVELARFKERQDYFVQRFRQ